MRRAFRRWVAAASAFAVLTAVAFATTPIGASAFRATTPPTTSGTLILSKRVAAPSIKGTVFLVKYWSKSSPANKPVQVTGSVMVPAGKPPPGGWPVVSWAHSANGMNGKCAASKTPGTNLPSVNNLLAKGWEVVATDYQGEGNPALAPTTKGLHPIFVGTNSGRDTIDIVRAARHLAAAHASNHYVVSGHSEGGQTAMFALKIAASYAPKLHLDGVVALSPLSQFNGLLAGISGSDYWPFLLMIIGGFHAAYGSAADVSQVLTTAGIDLLPSLLRTGCFFSILTAASAAGGFNSLVKSPTLPSAWQSLIDQNDPANFTTASSTPLLIVHGDADELIPVSTSATIATHLCGLHQDLERWTNPGLDHTGVVDGSSGSDVTTDVVHWITDRFGGAPNPDPYTPTGNGNYIPETTTCS
jgi:pimeloyl-ACP methyl ester carboxylesterase